MQRLLNDTTKPPRQFPANREGRRLRYMRRLSACPDAEGRWNVFIERIARHFDADADEFDRLLDGIIDLAPDQVALYAEVCGARR
jgi:hypothetical protein